MRATGLAASLPLIVTVMVAQAASAPGSVAAIRHQLHDTETQLHEQRAQAQHLRTRVTHLEQLSDSHRVQLEQRDRQITQLQDKLQALSAGQAGRQD